MKTRKVRLLLPLLAYFLVPFGVYAQEAADSTTIRRSAIHLELWGASGIASVNYERILFTRSKFGLAARLGGGAMRLKDFTRRFNPDIVLPFGVYGSYDLGNVLVEAGGGGAYTNIVYPDEATFEPERIGRVHAWFSLGVHSDLDQPIFGRFAVVPIFEFGRVTPTLTLGLGYQF